MSLTTLWWVLTGIAVAIELMTGTFYLLLVAAGMASGALASLAGLGLSSQILVSALVGGGSVVLWHLWRRRSAPSQPASQDPGVNLDVGAVVHVAQWDAEGLASVRHRGATWVAQLEPGHVAATGAHRITAVVGSRLVVTPM